MIFVGGVPRSCTSILMMCLKNSGYYLGAESHLHGHKYKSEYQPLGLTIQWVLNNKIKITQLEFTILQNVATFTISEKVEAIKVFGFCFVLPLLKDHKILKDAKFIIMSRDVGDAVLSAKRVNEKKVVNENSFSGLLKTWDFFTKDYQRIKLTYHDVIYKTNEVRDRLSTFLGREIDMSVIDPRMTYEASGNVN